MGTENRRRCSSCGEAKPAQAFPERTGQRCLDCRRADGRRHYQSNRAYYVAKARKRQQEVIAEVRVWLTDYLMTHPCVDCGVADVRVLEFDHRDPGEKRYAVSVLARGGYSLRQVQAEVLKCDVRCANCHRIRTHDQWGWWASSLRGN